MGNNRSQESMAAGIWNANVWLLICYLHSGVDGWLMSEKEHHTKEVRFCLNLRRNAESVRTLVSVTSSPVTINSQITTRKLSVYVQCVRNTYGREEKKIARRAGFEPARPEANGFQVHPVNHSGTVVRFVCDKLCYIKYQNTKME